MVITPAVESPEGVTAEPSPVTDAGTEERAGTADEGSARKGHCLCLHLLFDFWFVQLEHSLQGVARQAGHGCSSKSMLCE